MSARDMQRAKLYRAERDGALGVLLRSIDFVSIKDVQRYVDRLLDRRVVRRRFPLAVCAVRRHDYGRSWSFANGSGGCGTITLLDSHRSKMIVLHELAHIMSPRGAVMHGPEFAKMYLWLVHIMMGKPIADALRASFKRHGVRYRVVSEARRAAGRRLAATHGFKKAATPQG